MVFGTALSEVAVIFFGLFSVDGSGRWIPSDGRRWKGEETERTGAGGREREGFSLLKSKSRAEMVDIQDSRAFVRSTLLASYCVRNDSPH